MHERISTIRATATENSSAEQRENRGAANRRRTLDERQHGSGNYRDGF